jgi:hypothetical protein
MFWAGTLSDASGAWAEAELTPSATPAIQCVSMKSILLLLISGAIFGAIAAEPDVMKMTREGTAFSWDYKPALDALAPGEINCIRDGTGRCLLHVAAGGGHQARCLALLANGAEVNARDDRGRTPLFHCLEAEALWDKCPGKDGPFMVLGMLVLRGADIDVQSAEGFSRPSRLQRLAVICARRNSCSGAARGCGTRGCGKRSSPSRSPGQPAITRVIPCIQAKNGLIRCNSEKVSDPYVDCSEWEDRIKRYCGAAEKVSESF